MKNLTTAAYAIGDCMYNTPLGKTFLRKYTKELERHREAIHELAKLAFEAAKRQLMQPINYQTKPRKKILAKAIARIELTPYSYKRLDELAVKLDSPVNAFSDLNHTSDKEVKELVKLERLLKPSIEFSESILTFLNIPLVETIGAEPVFISAKKAAEILGIHPNTFRNWDEDGLIKRYTIQNTRPVRYKYQDVIALLKSS